jgi:hypothetical protein
MDLRKLEWEVTDWIHMGQERDPVAGSCDYGNKPLRSTRGGGNLTK